MLPGASWKRFLTCSQGANANVELRAEMRSHPGLIVPVLAVAVGVVLEAVGQNLVGTVLILGALLLALGSARNRSRPAAIEKSSGPSLPRAARRPPH